MSTPAQDHQKWLADKRQRAQERSQVIARARRTEEARTRAVYLARLEADTGHQLDIDDEEAF